MRKIFFFFLLFLIVKTTFAQQGTIKGTVTDTLNKQKLYKATISLLRATDSVLLYYTKTTQDGSFTFNNIKQGNYLLLATYPSFADYFDTLTLTKEMFDIGDVKLTPKAHLLSDVTVRQKIAAVRMKGDTIIYKADSFKLKEGASVEDLLKRFPGVQVDKNGNITAMGTKVEKVLVDGEEFFGDDPTIATKGLNASMVNEVQIFDKKSDQATFTGIDDGETKRTINLKLKDDAKKGWFGKLEASSNAGERWNNSLMANSFKNKRKISIYGINSSTGKLGLDWDERGKFGGESDNNMNFSEDGGTMYVVYGGGDNFDDPSYWGEGIPKSWSAAVNYGNKFNNDKQSINGSYKYGKIVNAGFGTTISQSILPDTLFFNTERRNVFGNKDRHSVNAAYDWMIDSSFSVKATIVASKGSIIGIKNYYSEALNEFSQPVNRSNRNTTTNGTNENIKASVLLRKKFKKAGRTLSVNIEQLLTGQNSTGTLFAVNDFFNKAGTLSTSDTTDQQKLNEAKNNTTTIKTSFTEQLVKNVIVEVSYSINNSRSNNKLLSFDKASDGKYTLLNTDFSNDFKFNIVTHQTGTVFKYSNKKLNVNIGGNVAFANFKQQDLLNDTGYNYKFTNFFPLANFTYKFNANKRLRFSYNGSTQQPTINQIQPLADNSNPLFIKVGNFNLKQEFNHVFNVGFNNYQVLKNRGFWLSAGGSFNSNAIRNSLLTDTSGRTISQFVNINGNYNVYINYGYHAKWQKPDIDYSFNYSINHNNNVSIVNNVNNITKNTAHNFGINLSKDVEDKFGIWTYSYIAYNISTSSIRPDINTKYWTFNGGANIDIELPWKLRLTNNFELYLRQKTPIFNTNNNVFIWNAYLSKKILKGNKSEIRFSAFDMLNQNLGFQRNISSTVISENTYNQLARYFMLSFIWNFSKGGATLNK
jgi:hypothetical protein